jgi:adenylosuccinate synthase
VYERREGWSAGVSTARRDEDLPDSVRRYLGDIEARVKVPVAIASVGADRDATIVRSEVFPR